MKRAIEKCWRESASLIIATKRNHCIIPDKLNTDKCNYDILLQTRPHNASFANSVVFPGGVNEDADGDDRWFEHLSTFGFTQNDFENFHQLDHPLTPLFHNNPIQRHVALRITAIRETFEELGLLICSRDHKSERSNTWASVLSDADLKHWRERVSKNSADLLTLCKEFKCYPDIWSLHYWSNWLTPIKQPKRFDTAFFITAFESKPSNIINNSEVVDVKWLSPSQILESCRKSEVICYPPQAYEFNRLSLFSDINDLIKFAQERSSQQTDLLYPVYFQARDGLIALLPGDYLYPTEVDFNDTNILQKDQSLLELRGNNQSVNRIEASESKRELVIKNYHPENHVVMNNVIISLPLVTIV